MGYLDRAISIKGTTKSKSDKPELRIFNFSFNVNAVAVRMLSDGYNDYYDLKYIPEEKLLVFCIENEGCGMNGSKTVLFSRCVLRRRLEDILPHIKGCEYFTYQIEGKYIPEENIIIFDISKAQRI